MRQRQSKVLRRFITYAKPFQARAYQLNELPNYTVSRTKHIVFSQIIVRCNLDEKHVYAINQATRAVRSGEYDDVYIISTV